MARTPISKKSRFEVFKRDGFVCQYCGSHPPEVVLEVDHINPVAKGGLNDQDNLVTSCFNCNRGKSDRLLSAVPQSLSDKAKDVAEREEQIRGYQSIMQARRQRIEDEVWEILRLYLPDDNGTVRTSHDRFNSTKNFISKLGFDEVYEAMELAIGRKPGKNNITFKYFCGICWNKIKDQQNG